MELKKLSLGEIKHQYNAVKMELENAKKNLALVAAEIEDRTKSLLNDYGTSHRIIDGVKIKLVKAKNIAWDGEALAELYAQIKADGAEPDQYIKRKETFTVSENEYKLWSEDMQAAFDVARTEKEAKFTFEFEGDTE